MTPLLIGMPSSPRPGSQPHAVFPGSLQGLVLDLAWRLWLGKKIGSISGPGPLATEDRWLPRIARHTMLCVVTVSAGLRV
jgi:hypothetical protein